MALKRIYTFEQDVGLNLKRVLPTEAAPEDIILKPAELTNWQLATLFVISLQESATSSEIGFALVMDRPTVFENLGPLEKRRAIKKVSSRGSRKGAVQITDSGTLLLEQGLKLWRAAHNSDPPSQTEAAKAAASPPPASMKFA